MKAATCARERASKGWVVTYHATLHSRNGECRLTNWLETITFPDPKTGEALWFKFARRVRVVGTDRIAKVYFSDFENQRVVLVHANSKKQEIPLVPITIK